MSNRDRRLAALEEKTATPAVSYSQARERAISFYGPLYKIYGQGAEPTGEEIEELTQIIMAGKYEQWVSEQIHDAYAKAEQAHTKKY